MEINIYQWFEVFFFEELLRILKDECLKDS